MARVALTAHQAVQNAAEVHVSSPCRWNWLFEKTGGFEEFRQADQPSVTTTGFAPFAPNSLG
jgi:hypothetical protein